MVLVNNGPAILYDIWQSAVNADLEVVNQALITNLFGPLETISSVYSSNEEKQIWTYCKCVKWSRLTSLYD